MSCPVPLDIFYEQMHTFLPVGYRFHPTDEELVNYYLRRQIFRYQVDPRVIPEIHGVYKIDPPKIPRQFRELSIVRSKEAEWWFFTHLLFKSRNSSKYDRQTPSGHWKATGQEKKINAKGTNELIGTMRNLVFIENEGSSAKQTVWVMHEYRLNDCNFGANFLDQKFVLCHLVNKRDEFIDDSTSVEAGSISSLMNLGNDKVWNNIPENIMEATMSPLEEALRPAVNVNLSSNDNVHITNENLDQSDWLSSGDEENKNSINEFLYAIIRNPDEIYQQRSGREPETDNGQGRWSPVDRPIEQGEHADRLRQPNIRPPGKMSREETGVHAQDNSQEQNFPPIFMIQSVGYDPEINCLTRDPVPTRASRGRDRVQPQIKPSGKPVSKGKVTPSKKPVLPCHKPILRVKKHSTCEAKPAQCSCASEVSPTIPVLPRKYMFPPADYHVDFPPQAEVTDEHGKYHHTPKVLNPTDVEEAGRTKEISSMEAVLNWQSKNALAQNRILKSIHENTLATNKILRSIHENTLATNKNLKSIHSKISKVQTRLDYVDQKVDKTAVTMQELLCILEKLLDYI